MAVDILIVEDDPLAGAMLEDLLREQGYRVRLLTEGAGVLASAKALKPRAVVLDILLPGQDGLSLCRAIKADAELRGVRVVVVSGKAYGEDEARAVAAGADDFVAKTAGAARIIASIRSAVGPPPKRA